MDRLGNLQFQILVKLADNMGHGNRELAEGLGVEKSNLSTSMKKLEELGLIRRGEQRISTNPRSAGRRYQEMPFYLETADFQCMANLIIDYALKEDRFDELEYFLGSNYVDLMIKERSFDKTYLMWSKYFENSKFKKVASKALLNQQSTIEEYENFLEKLPEFILKTPQHESSITYHRLGAKLNPSIKGSWKIELLKNFDKLEAVKFFRGTLTEGLQEFSADNLEDPLMPKAFTDFANIDMYLSPFSSFPMESIMDILFYRPFEKLYDDFYLIDYKYDLELFVERAFKLYYNFEEILTFALNYFGYRKEYIELMIKQWILYWNRSANTIDLLNANLKHLEPGEYHVSVDNLGHTVMDLKQDKFLPRIHTSPLVINGIDPFTNLIPCNCFDESEKQQRTLAEILENIKSRLPE